jgi:hypothetical protein
MNTVATSGFGHTSCAPHGSCPWSATSLRGREQLPVRSWPQACSPAATPRMRAGRYSRNDLTRRSLDLVDISSIWCSPRAAVDAAHGLRTPIAVLCPTMRVRTPIWGYEKSPAATEDSRGGHATPEDAEPLKVSGPDNSGSEPSVPPGVGSPSSPQLSFILDEAVLQLVGHSGTSMARQLRRLLELSDEREIHLTIIPFAGPDRGAAVDGSFSLLHFPDPFDNTPPLSPDEGWIDHEYLLLRSILQMLMALYRRWLLAAHRRLVAQLAGALAPSLNYPPGQVARICGSSQLRV